MELIGKVVRLQVQRARLKPGPAGARVYDPTPLLEVEALEVGPRGCVGRLGEATFVDVHHADHPDTRNVKLANSLSLLPCAAYPRLQALYGEHLRIGAAGESVLVDVAGPWPPGELLLETDDQPLLLAQVQAALPCVEFSRFCLGLPVGAMDGVEQALSQLDGGARGFYAQPQGHGVVTVGARLWLA